MIIPKNWSLFAVNFFVGCAGGSQLFRIWRYALIRVQVQLSINQEFINAASLSVSATGKRNGTIHETLQNVFATLLAVNIFSLTRAALNGVSSSWIKGLLSRAAFVKKIVS